MNGTSNHVLKQNLKRITIQKGTLRKQLNKHQNLQKELLKAENNFEVECLSDLFCQIQG